MARMMDSFCDAIRTAFFEMYNAAETEEHKAALLSKFEKADWTSYISNLFDDVKQETFSTLKSSMFEQVYMKMHRDTEFLARLQQTWFRAYVASEAMYILVLETVSNHDTRISNMSKENRMDKENRYFALKFIHGRVLQQFLEVLTLMKNGLADGAYSRWRSMYELGIIAQFIIGEPEEVAESYINSNDIDNNYDWAKASNVFKNKKGHIHFSDIERKTSFPANLWKEQFKLACTIIHPSSRGTFGRLAHAKGEHLSYVPVGRSNYGMTEPGECSAITLSQVTVMLMSVYALDEVEVMALDCIVRWADFVRAEYFQAHDYAFPEYSPKIPLLNENKRSLHDLCSEQESSDTDERYPQNSSDYM